MFIASYKYFAETSKFCSEDRALEAGVGSDRHVPHSYRKRVNYLEKASKQASDEPVNQTHFFV
jgi:hypothetical protein